MCVKVAVLLGRSCNVLIDNLIQLLNDSSTEVRSVTVSVTVNVAIKQQFIEYIASNISHYSQAMYLTKSRQYISLQPGNVSHYSQAMYLTKSRQYISLQPGNVSHYFLSLVLFFTWACL